MTITLMFSRTVKGIALVFFLGGVAHDQQCQITSPLPMPITIQGCTYSSTLPGGSTSYIQNTSSLQSGATAYPDFLYVGSSVTAPTVVDTGLTSGMCVQAGTNGLLTSAAAACGSGGGGGTLVASNTYTAPYGINASTITVSTVTIGSVQILSVFDNTGAPTSVQKLVFMPLTDQQHIIQFWDSSMSPMLTIDSHSRRFGFFTAAPDSSVEWNSNVHIDGTARIESGIRIPTTSGAFSFQGLATLVAGSAVVTNGIIDSTYSIYMTIQTPGGAVGSVYVSSITANTTFNILSTSVADTSTVGWLMVQH